MRENENAIQTTSFDSFHSRGSLLGIKGRSNNDAYEILRSEIFFLLVLTFLTSIFDY